MFFLSALCVGNMLLNAQVATTYTFSQTTTAYSALTSPTNISTADNATSAITIPFPFAFNGVYYTSVNANTNGYVNFGTALATTNYTPISATTSGNTGVISGMGMDLGTYTASPGLCYLTAGIGTAPNRIFVIEYRGARRYFSSATQTGDNINFQIRLHETSNVVEIIYGTCTATSTTSANVQVGIRGAATTDYLNRTGTWGGSTAGGANNVTISTSNTSMPSSGLTFRWTPTHPVIPAPNVSNNGPIVCGNTANLTASNLAPSGQVATFNGSSSTATSAISGQTAINNTFTVEFWANPSNTITIGTQGNTGTAGTSGQRWAVTPDHRGTAAGMGVSVGTNGVVVGEHGDSYLPTNLVHAIALTGWHHIAIVYNSRTPALYVDGVFVKNGTISARATVYPSSGSSYVYGFYQGSMDNLRIWSGARSQADIRASMYLETPTGASGGTLTYQYKYNSSNGTDNVSAANSTHANVTYSVANYFTYTWGGGATPPAASTAETQTTSGTLATTQTYTVTASLAGSLIPNTGSGNNTVTVTCGTPSISTIPSTACVGQTIAITGTNLGGATAVTVNGASATITSNTATQIEVTAPAGAVAGSPGNIEVTTLNGTATQGSISVYPTATPGTFAFTNGSTQSICSGSTISCANGTSPTNGGSGNLTVVWYCSETNSGTYPWLRSTTASALQTATAGGNGLSLSNYNPQADFPGFTSFIIIRRAYTDNCSECLLGPSGYFCQDQTFYVNVLPAPPSTIGVNICAEQSGSLTSSSSCSSHTVTGNTVTASATINGSSTSATPVSGSFTLSGLPASAAITNIAWSGSTASTTDWRSELRFQISKSGSTSISIQNSTAQSAGSVTQAASSNGTFGGTANGTYTIGWADITSPYQVTLSNQTVNVTVTYSYTTTDVQWSTTPSGSSIFTGNSFNPVGVAGSGLTNTNTPGTTTFYAFCPTNNTCRTATDFVINSGISFFNVTGGGSYCSGGSGLAVGLSGSQAGISYQLVRDGVTNVGSPVAGTGSALAFGNQTTGGVYTVVASGSGCSNVGMTGSATVTVNTVPAVATTPSPANAATDVCFSGTGAVTSVSWALWQVPPATMYMAMPTLLRQLLCLAPTKPALHLV